MERCIYLLVNSQTYRFHHNVTHAYAVKLNKNAN